MGIVSSFEDIDFRDKILGEMALKNSHAAGKFGQTLEFLEKVSTLEARLRVMVEHNHQFTWWMKEYQPDTATLQKLGLTREQLSSALAAEH